MGKRSIPAGIAWGMRGGLITFRPSSGGTGPARLREALMVGPVGERFRLDDSRGSQSPSGREKGMQRLCQSRQRFLAGDEMASFAGIFARKEPRRGTPVRTRIVRVTDGRCNSVRSGWEILAQESTDRASRAPPGCRTRPRRRDSRRPPARCSERGPRRCPDAAPCAS
jgi:hypothetical protein